MDTPDHGHQHPHEHGDHDHSHAHPRGLKGAVLAIFSPHSHDAADSIDTALESSERGIRAVKISFSALLVTSAFQLAVIIASGSVGLLADTIHNFSDALTAVPLFLAFRLARRPPTRRYTYGYGRAEDIAGLFVIAMITLSAIIAAYEAINRSFHPTPSATSPGSPPLGSSASSVTSSSPSTESVKATPSDPPRSSPTATTPAPTDSPPSPSCSAPSESGPASKPPTPSLASSSPLPSSPCCAPPGSKCSAGS